MPTVRDFVALVEQLAPPHIKFEGDPIGLFMFYLGAPISKLVATLDCTDATLDFAIKNGSEAILAHHPVIWDPIKSVLEQGRLGALIRKATKHGIAIMAAHTNLDNASPGINDTLADLLALNQAKPFGAAALEPVWLMVTYCQAENVPSIIQAASRAGAGNFGEYSECAYQNEGVGQFTPSGKANPHVGQVGQQNRVAEARVEIYTPDSRRGAVMAAIKTVHPYEEVLITFVATAEPIKHMCGRLGVLAHPMSLAQLTEHVNQSLGCQCQVWAPRTPKMVSKVAVIGGAASFDWENALRVGADVFLTGEAKQNHVIDATEQGMAVVQAGHYHTEHPGIVRFGQTVAEKLGIEFFPFEPEPGYGGRPL